MDYQSYESYQNQANTVRKTPLAKASLIMGVLALLTIATGVLPLLFGALGVLFAILSHRKRKPLDTSALLGAVTSAIGLSIAIVMFAITIMMLPTMLKDPEYREQLNSLTESMYGASFDEVMEEGWGIDLDKMLESK
jgi:hypothetical protein